MKALVLMMVGLSVGAVAYAFEVKGGSGEIHPPKPLPGCHTRAC